MRPIDRNALLPPLAVFLGSACIMVIELVAGRLIARFLGQSLYTWTAVIGIILAGISIGNVVGGRLADRFEPRRLLAAMFFIGAVLSLLTPLVSYAAGQSLWLASLDLRARIFIHVSLAFLPASIALGSIGPIAADMAVKQASAGLGRALGGIYAWGAAGSIVGTFLTGYYLIGAFGTAVTLLIAAAVLLGLAVAFGAAAWTRRGVTTALGVAVATWAVGAVASGPMHARLWTAVPTVVDGAPMTVLWQKESPYSQVTVTARKDLPRYRMLYLDKLTHSGCDVDRATNLIGNYTWMVDGTLAALAGPTGAVDVLVIGGGGYTLPRALSVERPGSRIVVAEIDPVVTEAAQAACGLGEVEERPVGGGRWAVGGEEGTVGGGRWAVGGETNTGARCEVGGSPQPRTKNQEPPTTSHQPPTIPHAPITVIHQDGRQVVQRLLREPKSVPGTLNREPGTVNREPGTLNPLPLFSFVIGDTIEFYSIPYHLTTREFNEEVAALLAPSGVYLLHVVSDDAAGAPYLGALVNTLRRTFPHVAAVTGKPTLARRTSVLLLASRATLDMPRIAAAIQARHATFVGRPIAAAELDRWVGQCGGVVLTDDYAPVEQLVAGAARQDRTDWVNRQLSEAMRLHSSGYEAEAEARVAAVLALEPDNPSALYVKAGQRRQAVDYRGALACVEPILAQDADMFPARVLRGELLAALERVPEAIVEWETVLATRPKNLDALNDLGYAAEFLGDGTSAVARWEGVLQLKPNDPTAHFGLARGYARQGDPERAAWHRQQAKQCVAKGDAIRSNPMPLKTAAQIFEQSAL